MQIFRTISDYFFVQFDDSAEDLGVVDTSFARAGCLVVGGERCSRGPVVDSSCPDGDNRRLQAGDAGPSDSLLFSKCLLGKGALCRCATGGPSSPGADVGRLRPMGESLLGRRSRISSQLQQSLWLRFLLSLVSRRLGPTRCIKIPVRCRTSSDSSARDLTTVPRALIFLGVVGRYLTGILRYLVQPG